MNRPCWKSFEWAGAGPDRTVISSGTGVVEQWSTEFIVGTRDIASDAEWQAYLRELDRAGLKRYVELWQKTITDAGY